MTTSPALPAKTLVELHRSSESHWVGDGFPVRTVFTYDDLGNETLSPFLLMDYGGPAEFKPTRQPRGVGEHPHRGFETVTIVFDGEVEHRDSAGGGGTIGPGDVQWMTAGSGVMHEEKHSRAFTTRGGPFEMIQLWVDLPARDKLVTPRYQTLTRDRIPVVPIAEGRGHVRVIAGEFAGVRGPAQTFSPINLWDLHLAAGAEATFDLPEGSTTACFVRRGKVHFQASAADARETTLALLSREGRSVRISAAVDSDLLLLNGAPLAQPVVVYGPFVMTSMEEIQEAFAAARAGEFGALKPVGA